jgi:Uma2 family endonuclease
MLEELKAQDEGAALMSTMIASQTAATPKTEVTPEELLAMPDGGHYELIDGELKDRNMSLLSSRVAVSLARRLDVHCDQYNLGWVVDAECGYKCFPWNPKRIRRADVSFIGADRLPSDEERFRGYVTIPPDLAVEIVSPNDRVNELEEKVEEYLKAGVRLVWVVHPDIRAVQVYRADGTTGRCREHDELSGEDVLPGFRCKVVDLFPKQPEVETNSPTMADSVSSPPSS